MFRTTSARIGVTVAVGLLTMSAIAPAAVAQDVAPAAVDGRDLAPTDTPADLIRDLSAACPSGSVPRGTFDDVSGGTFGLAVDCLSWYDVTQGVGGGRYDLRGEVTRGQMANFLYRLIEYNLGADAMPSYSGTSRFSDVPAGSGQARAINVLASSQIEDLLGRRIVTGFGDGTYGPGEPVRRDQMGTFMARTLEGLVEALGGEITDRGFCTFADSSRIASTHRSNVSLVCAFGIAGGRADGTYGPGENVSRGQMAAFLMRLQDNLADEPLEVPTPDRR
jgi:hypothetical protein